MPKTIVQTVTFSASPQELYSLYVNSKKHSAATGSNARISGKVGGSCEAYDGSLTGTTLGNIRNRLFVQTWRSDDWSPEQADSILTLMFEKHGKGGRLTMVHANIPDEHYPGIKTGWTDYYWTPWRRYLGSKGRRKKKLKSLPRT
jgi:activator of HSP90 ATPase